MEEEKIGNSVQEILISLLKEGKEVWVGTDGRSMYPLIKEGDFVKIRPMKAEELKLGDVVAFQPNNGHDLIIVHRLLKRNKDSLITRGDSYFLKHTDLPVPADNFLGKIIALRRNGKTKSLEYGFLGYYGRFISYFGRYGFPLLFLLLCLVKIITGPYIFSVKAIRYLREFIKII